MLREYLSRPAEPEPAIYDRTQTIGASEIGMCARRVWFAKHGAKPDPQYVEGWGFMDRGHSVERWAVERMLANGAPLTHALEQQVTLVDGFVSGTPDGLWDGEWSIDIKSFDPRKSRFPEPAHVMQVKVAACLWRKPEMKGSVLIYINASDFADAREFAFPIEPDALAKAKDRAREIMSAPRHDALPAEGWIAQECGLCPFARQCVGEVPKGRADLPEPDRLLIEAHRAEAASAKAAKDAAEIQERAAKERIMNVLRAADVRRVPGLARLSVTNGRQSLDTEAMERAGIDLSLYRKAGRPSESITLE